MERIQGLRPQTFVSAPVSRSKKASAAPVRDTFTLTSTQPPQAETTKALTTEQIRDLGSRYDVTDMTRDQFSSLLKELRDAGAITQKAFSDGYTGAAPEGMTFNSMPVGDRTANFLGILAARSHACTVPDGTVDPQRAALKESYAQLYKVINGMYIAHSRLETPEERAARIIKNYSRTPEELGIPDLTGLSDIEKLKVLADLHDATDYDGMNDVSRYKLIQDRFEAVFPNQLMYDTYWGGRRYDNSVPWDGSAGPKTFRDSIRDEQERQWDSAGIFVCPVELHCQAYYGGHGLSDETVDAIIRLRHSGGTAGDQAAMLAELRFWYGGGPEDSVTGSMLELVRNDLKGMGPDAALSWQELKQMISARSQDCDEVLQDAISRLLDELDRVCSSERPD